MKTAAEREAAFRADFEELLKRHKAEFDVTDDGRPYGLHSGVAEVTMISEYDGQGNQTAEFAQFRI
jgi:hypothetical protein